jgi:hypothetical protein
MQTPEWGFRQIHKFAVSGWNGGNKKYFPGA